MTINLQEITTKYSQRVDRVISRLNPDAHSSFLDQAENRLNTLTGLNMLVGLGKRKLEEAITPFFTATLDLAQYLDLVEKYPDYAEKEARGDVTKTDYAIPLLRRDTTEEEANLLGYKSLKQFVIWEAKKIEEIRRGDSLVYSI